MEHPMDVQEIRWINSGVNTRKTWYTVDNLLVLTASNNILNHWKGSGHERRSECRDLHLMHLYPWHIQGELIDWSSVFLYQIIANVSASRSGQIVDVHGPHSSCAVWALVLKLRSNVRSRKTFQKKVCMRQT